MTVAKTMDNSKLTEIVSQMLHKATTQPGVTAAAVGGSTNTGLAARLRLGEVESIEFHRDKSLSIVVYKGQRSGSVSITDLTPESIDSAVAAACRIAEYTQPDPCAGLADVDRLAKDIQDLDLYHPAGITAEQAIEYSKECEAAGLSYDKKITNSSGAGFSTNDSFYVYGNSNGFLSGYSTTRYSASCTLIGLHGDKMQREHEYSVARNVQDLESMSTIGSKAAEKTIARLGARKIKTCKVPVLLTPKMATQIWGCLIAAISGGNLYRKSSFLLNHLNKQIFPGFVNVLERPHIKGALGSAPFDNEGVATTNKAIVQDGILNSYLLGSYSARQLGMQTTGNAGGVHNCTIVPGQHDQAQLLNLMGTGLLVTDLMGDGENIITGDYSQGAVGFWVDKGEIAYPVEEITIAGNLREMFASLIAIGNDVDSRSNIITGSLLLDEMIVAGA